MNSCCGLIPSGFIWARVASSGLIWARAPLSASIFRAKAVWNLNALQISSCSTGCCPPPFPRAGPNPEVLTFPSNSLFKTVHIQLRPLYHPFREPDPSQKCLHFQLTFSLKVLIFSSGCLPSLSGSRTRARNAYISN